ncbi:MAG: FAD-binding protein [Rhodobacteraceae bacterium]|nr:FAD-binding protein [Paracoccaceae bacterium]
MQADYVIVGAGSAGCAMAYRLSEAGHSVIVIEFGGSDAGPLIQMPGALSYPMNMSRYDWGYWSEPEPYLGGRQLACPRGKVIGGSSSINGMVYVRGHARDFDKGASQVISANVEVIIAASAINSPKLLMLSGIGDADHLQAHGIPVVADRKGVGQNLQDHLELYIQMAASQPVSLYKYWNLLGKAWVGLQWLLNKSGPGASNQFESAAFIRSRAGVEYPDIQYHFLPIAVRYDGQAAAEGHGFQAHVGPMRSPSRGSVTLRSSDPAEAPKILFNYMSHEKDWEDFRRCIRLTREIFAQEAFAPFVRHEIQPGADVQSDDALNSFIKDHVESAYHPCGTCKMGDATDPMAVVDPECRVIGVSGLRVADSSIFPQITNGNLNGPSIMVGEKASDHILGRAPMPASNKEPWIHPNWESHQR